MYLESLRFSLWVDFIQRDFLDGEFRELIDQGIINGATSNPAIFKNAILHSDAYKQQLQSLKGSPKERYEALAIFDIQKAADILRPLYERGDDGYVSIEIDPNLCDDAAGSISEGLRLYEGIGRENVMIKIPATNAGYEAMHALAMRGIAVNATLVFTKSQAKAALEALQGGKASSVISVFVSRIDRALDAKLAASGVAVGLTGIYNASAIYEMIEQSKTSKTRCLFASTGVKGGEFAPHYYIEHLLAYNSINTAPIETIKAYIKNGSREAALPIDKEKIEAHMARVASLGIDLESLLQRQVEDGLEAFKVAFSEILEAL